MSEHQLAYALCSNLPSFCFFSWTDKVAGFTDERDAETFLLQFPDWKV